MSGYLIHTRRELAKNIFDYWIEAPRIARKYAAGQFVILRLHDRGERIPLTVVNTDRDLGLIRLIVQATGKTTEELAQFQAGDHILDLVGPLGQPTHISPWGSVVIIGGGVGAAPLLPIAKAAKNFGNRVYGIIGARSSNLLLLVNEFSSVCNDVRVCTDDGSEATRGVVTDVLNQWCGTGMVFDFAITAGPVLMMREVGKTLAKWQIPGLASLNPIMVDGTGMCGACRVTVHHSTKFACVEGPEFDIHGVDFDELDLRNRAYAREERTAVAHAHSCQLSETIQRVREEA